MYPNGCETMDNHLQERIDRIVMLTALRSLEGLPEIYTSTRAYKLVTEALDAVCKDNVSNQEQCDENQESSSP